MKRISEKRFYFTFNHRFFWSKAFQSLTPSAINLMMCFQTELRWSKGKRRSKKRKSGFVVVCGAPEPSTDCQIQACHWDVDHDAGKFKIQGFKAQDARSFIIFVYWESEIRDPEGKFWRDLSVSLCSSLL